MAQRSGPSPRDPKSTWDGPYHLPTFFDNLNSPVVPAPSNNGAHSHFNSSLFSGQEVQNISSESHQDPTPQTSFMTNSANGTSSGVDNQGKELLKILLQEAEPTKREIREEIMNEVKPAVKKEVKDEVKKEIKEEMFNEIRDIIAEVTRLRSSEAEVAGMKSDVAEMKTLWTQQLRYQLGKACTLACPDRRCARTSAENGRIWGAHGGRRLGG
ncbi:hypothetical protein V491_07855 [Pseudogymnoascus sp. VKM F-3775]|nr:hypothetical protein V491_07855 [Pseudogymnoascus sp. VKM F-3775]